MTRTARAHPDTRSRPALDDVRAAAVADYLADHYWAEDEVLSAVVADTAARGPSIQVGVEGGQLLAVLLRAIGARRVLELGTLFGYSGIWIARNLPADGHLDTVELDELHADAAQHWFQQAGVADRVTIHRGRAVDVVAGLPGPYDLAFVDADKENYPRYAELALERLRPGGVLVVDNVIRGGAIVDAGHDGAVGTRSVGSMTSSPRAHRRRRHGVADPRRHRRRCQDGVTPAGTRRARAGVGPRLAGSDRATPGDDWPP